MTVPRFAVVGHVNRGKSSIVSTLAADETVRIADTPGTTRACRTYPLRVEGRTLYELIDTPGFERARHALHWLKQGEGGTRDRRARVEAFVKEHRGRAFPQECALLEPILAGAAILYVVDGSVPFQPTAEAETEILQWTGQPRMALINPIAGADYVDEWRPVLDQYFSLVRVFDAHQADFRERIELLRGLRELSDSWRAALDHAIDVLEQDRVARRRECADAIADTLIDVLTLVEEKRLGPDEVPEQHVAEVEARYYDALRQRELRMRQAIRQAYLHDELQVTQAGIDRVEADLFDTGTWSRLGLSRAQLLAAGAAAGGVAGGVVDAALGGASFLLGAAVGSAVGAASSWWAWDRLARVAILGTPLGGRSLRIGPMPNANFPWVVLDRALIFHHAVSRHAHARRTPVDLTGVDGIVSTLDAGWRDPIAKLLERLRSHPDARGAAEARRELPLAIDRLLEAREAQ